MSYSIDPIQITTTNSITIQLGSICDPAQIGAIVIANESIYSIKCNASPSGEKWIGGWIQDVIYATSENGFNGTLTIAPLLITTATDSPSSSLLITIYLQNELDAIKGTYPIALVRQTNIGNGVVTVGSDTSKALIPGGTAQDAIYMTSAISSGIYSATLFPNPSTSGIEANLKLGAKTSSGGTSTGIAINPNGVTLTYHKDDGSSGNGLTLTGLGTPSLTIGVTATVQNTVGFVLSKVNNTDINTFGYIPQQDNQDILWDQSTLAPNTGTFVSFWGGSGGIPTGARWAIGTLQWHSPTLNSNIWLIRGDLALGQPSDQAQQTACYQYVHGWWPLSPTDGKMKLQYDGGQIISLVFHLDGYA